MMKVIGIDPAPAKETVIYDGEKFIEVPAIELKKEYLDKLEEGTLICWDAPLTGMATEDAIRNFQQYLEALAKSKKKKKPKWSPLEARIIEKYIALQDPTTIPKGISTLPYTGCSHWAITQHCFGLPLINDEFKPPETLKTFKLITSQNEREKLSSNKKNIIEVHPALALWLWLKKANEAKSEFDSEFDWDYKKNKETFKILAKQLFDKFGQPKAITEPKDQANEKYRIKVTVIKKNKVEAEEKPKNMTDDHLDAYIAWKLGDLWLNKQDEVILVGNKNTGAMLLPNDMEKVSENWQSELKEYK